MCGIYGMAKSPRPYTKKEWNEVRRIMRSIAIDSEVRGAHSSGVASVGNEVQIHKSLLESSRFVDTSEYNSVIKSLRKDVRIILGHTRFATAGSITKDNAHPFRVGNVVGAHNGCVYNIDEMQNNLDKYCPVDSQLMFKAIDINDNIQDAVKDFDSDFALCYVKDSPNVLNLCRETNRPLHVAYVKHLRTLFFASESAFLDEAIFKYTDLKDSEIKVIKLNTNTLYSYDVNKFDDEQTHCTKQNFDYESRVYEFKSSYGSWLKNVYNYKTFNTTKDDEIDLSEWSAANNFAKHLDEDELDYEWYEEEQLNLASVYGGIPENWNYDYDQQSWYYETADGDIMYEDVVSNKTQLNLFNEYKDEIELDTYDDDDFVDSSLLTQNGVKYYG